MGAYAGRMSIEETYRDWHSGWGVRAAAAALPSEATVERLIGLVCLTYLLQMRLGQRLSVDPVGQRTPAAMGRGTRAQPLVPAWIVVHDTVATPPKHKQNPGTAKERAARAKAHAQHRKHQRGRQTKPPSAAQRYAQTWVLFTTAATVREAVGAYAGRMSVEETYRDWHTGWGVRAAVVHLPSEAMVERLIGVVCLPDLLQLQLGQRLSADPVGRRRRAQWTVTDRVSWFWCGQHLFQDPGYDWSPWLDQQRATLGTSPPPLRPLPPLDPAVEQAA